MKKFIYSFVFFGMISQLSAQNLPANQVAVVRVGDGQAALTNAATAVFVDVFDISSGALLRTLTMPTAATGNNQPFAISGTSTTEGALNLAESNTKLVFGGYAAAPGLTSVSSNTTTSRVVATIDATGVPMTSNTIAVGQGFNTSSIRGCTSVNGVGYYCSGAGSSSTGGVRLVPVGTGVTTTGLYTTPTNTRAVDFIDNALYFTSASSPFIGVSKDSAGGTPTLAGNIAKLQAGIAGSSPSPNGFQVLDISAAVTGLDVMYMVDERTSATGGGLYKFAKVGTTWTPIDTLLLTNARGLTAKKSPCGGVTLFITTNNTLVSLQDNGGYNARFATRAFTTLATAATNTAFRGVAMTPGTGLGLPLAFMTSARPTTCASATSGRVDFEYTSQSTRPYNYAWGTGQTTQDNGTGTQFSVTGLASGAYNFTITDANGCLYSASATVSAGTNNVTATAQVTNPSCVGNNGNISLSASGGLAPYTYSWSNGGTTQNATGLSAGAIRSTITDANRCAFVYTATLTAPANSISITTASTNTGCGNPSGTASVTVTGAQAPIQYNWSNGGTTASITGLTARTYTVTVTDGQGCNKITAITVSQNSSLASTATQTAAITCVGRTNGAATVSVSGGTAPYSYLWTGANRTTQSISGLASGVYAVTIIDAGACATYGSVTISNPNAISITASGQSPRCAGQSNGTLTSSATGGTGALSFNWGNGVTTTNRTGLGAGTYTLTVTDANGCSVAATPITLTMPSLLTISITNVVNQIGTSANGSISTQANGGAAAFTYTWSNGASTQNITNVAAGNYTVTVRDANGCTASAQASIIITGTENLAGVSLFRLAPNPASSQAQLDLQFPNATSGQINLINSMGQTLLSTPFNDRLDHKQNIEVATLPGGLYFLKVTLTNGQTHTARLVVE